MVASRTDAPTKYPIYKAVEERFKGTQLPAICYPHGMAAYFADQVLSFGTEETVILEELRNGYLRRGEDQVPVKVEYPLEVAIDGFITNKFWMILAREILDSTIYDVDTFLEYMARKSPYAIWLGAGKAPMKPVCSPPGPDTKNISL